MDIDIGFSRLACFLRKRVVHIEWALLALLATGSLMGIFRSVFGLRLLGQVLFLQIVDGEAFHGRRCIVVQRRASGVIMGNCLFIFSKGLIFTAPSNVIHIFTKFEILNAHLLTELLFVLLPAGLHHECSVLFYQLASVCCQLMDCISLLGLCCLRRRS